MASAPIIERQERGTLRMDNGVSAGEVGGIFAGIVSLLFALGRAGKWLINWKGAREKSEAARLKAWEQSLDRREKEEREQTERRLRAMESKVSLMAAALFETIAELQVLDAGSTALAKAKLVLRQAFPADKDIPADIEALVRRVDNAMENRT